MPRTAIATPVGDGEVSTMRVDDLIQRGRSQGHLSLSELRTAFERAGIAPAEGRSILRELTDAGVRLANERQEPAKGKRTENAAAATAKASTAKASRAKTGAAKAAADGAAPTGSDGAEEAVADDRAIEAEAVALAEVDLDDQTPAMGDSVHTYLKSIGRTSLLTAEQEVDLAKRIEAGLFAEHKLDTEPGLSEDFRRDLEAVAEDGRRAKAHMLEANLRLVVSVA